MPLIKDGHLATDAWIALGDDAPLPPTTDPVIVSLARFRLASGSLLARGAPLGVRLKSGELAHEIGAVANRLGLIAVEFSTFRDGRPYSTARLLRERWGFTGELRAVGDVLRDQLLFMLRCGFDAFEVADARLIEAWPKATTEFSVFYQAGSDRQIPAGVLRTLSRRAAE